MLRAKASDLTQIDMGFYELEQMSNAAVTRSPSFWLAAFAFIVQSMQV